MSTGAYNSTLESEKRSEAAQRKVSGTDAILDESMTVREQVDLVVRRQRDSFDDRYEENEQQLTQLSEDIGELDGRIVDLNEMVGAMGGEGRGKRKFILLKYVNKYYFLLIFFPILKEICKASTYINQYSVYIILYFNPSVPCMHNICYD